MLLVRWLIHEGRERKEISRDNLFLVSFSLPLSSFFCVEKDLLCSSERCSVYYLKIQATESFEISQKSVDSHTVTNILPFFIVIFIFSLLRSSGHFHPELHANFRFFFKEKLLSVTIYWTAFIPNTLLFVIPNTMYVFCVSGKRN